MNIYQRAFVAVDRNSKKSIVLFLLLFIISNLIMAALLVRSAIDETVDHFNTNMPNQIALVIRSQNEECETCHLTLEKLTKIEDLSYVRQSSFGLRTHTLVSDELFYPVSFETAETCLDLDMCSFSLEGVSGLQMLEIEEDQLQVVEGRFFEEHELINGSPVVLVPLYLAELNGLNLGDQVTLNGNIGGGHPHESPLALNERHYVAESPYVVRERLYSYIWYPYTTDLEIIGFYDLAFETSSARAENLRNTFVFRLYAPLQYVYEFLDRQYELASQFYTHEELAVFGQTPPKFMYATFTLHDFRDYESFYHATAEILGDLYDDRHVSVSAFGEWSREYFSTSMAEMDHVLRLFLYLTVLACLVVMGLLITLFFRDRRFEMGIYLSLGAKRFQIIKQLLIELCYIIFPAYGLALLTSAILARRMNDFLTNQYLLLLDANESMNMMFYSNTISYDKVLSFHRISVNFSNLLWISAVLLIVLLLSLLGPFFSVLRLSPLTLLGKNKE
ncbi:MAG: ABC transporter permease [Defluviitaleaceae bacterium]|nr:ABC transporter permease [Defluviitaleaceae bacterium]